MIISLIAAVDEQGGIGKDNQLPWHLSSDLKRFKRLTMEHHVVMGRKTYETIGRSLPGRIMIVITHQEQYIADHCLVMHSLEDAIRKAEEDGESELFIIGGGEIFAQALSKADTIYLTVVRTYIQGDVFFPEIDPVKWVVVSKEKITRQGKDDYPSEFKVIKRR